MKLSDYIINFLRKQKITHIFEVSGGAITHLTDSLYDRKGIKTISMHHEQAAAFAAEGYSRLNGNFGVAMATSGPGATNLITGIASCFFDSIPAIFITGQVNTYEFKFEKLIRQMGFQETDIVSVVKPIVKEAILVKDAKKIRYYLEKAVFLAKSGRPGPVLLDIPMNIQRAKINPRVLKSFSEPSSPYRIKNINIIKKVIKLLESSTRPVVLVGGGLRLSDAEDELYRFIRKTNLPVVCSLMGKDSFANNNPEFVGMIGTYGHRYANFTIANADFILALGSRFDIRQTGTRPETFARTACIVHVDIDRNELNSRVKADVKINQDIKRFLNMLNTFLKKYDKRKDCFWKDTIKKYKYKYSFSRSSSISGICPNSFIHTLSQFIPDDAIICVDVGQNQIWAAQSLEIRKKQRFLTQGGLGAMGSALPFAIGASFVSKKRKVIVITGDGGLQLNSQELQTLYYYRMPIKIILLNNSCYGMVRQFQQQYFNSCFQSTVIGYNTPNFQKVVSAYQIKAQKITKESQIAAALHKLLRDNKPGFLEVKISRDINVLPKLAVNKPIEDQDPALPYQELKSNMFIDLLKS